jgi:hypothetical protein
LGIDLGGSWTRVTRGRRDEDGTFNGCEAVTIWPGRSLFRGISGIPTLVVTSKERTHDGVYKRMFWGSKAKRVYDDSPNSYVEHNYIKDYLMENHVPETSGDSGDLENVCLFFIRELLSHCISDKSVDSLLLHVGVPVHVEESEADRYLGMFKNASPIEDTTVRVTDEPTLAGIAINFKESKLLAGVRKDASEYRLITFVDFGSTTTVSGSERTLRYG